MRRAINARGHKGLLLRVTPRIRRLACWSNMTPRQMFRSLEVPQPLGRERGRGQYEGHSQGAFNLTQRATPNRRRGAFVRWLVLGSPGRRDLGNHAPSTTVPFAKVATKSSCLRVAIAAVFAAPLLRPMKMDSFAINWFSTTSDGKTAVLFIAASVAGLISSGGLPGWADSEPGIEDQALGHRDCILPLDETGDGNGKMPLKDKARMLAFMIARNRPRRLSKRHERANALQDREWRIIAQASSEAALSQVAIDAGDAPGNVEIGGAALLALSR
jgi:uncharacterized protein DUF927